MEIVISVALYIIGAICTYRYGKKEILRKFPDQPWDEGDDRFIRYASCFSWIAVFSFWFNRNL